MVNLDDLYVSSDELDCEEIYNAAQAYRTADFSDQSAVSAMYANLRITFAMTFERLLRERLEKAPEVSKWEKDGEQSAWFWKGYDFRFHPPTHRARLVCVEELRR